MNPTFVIIISTLVLLAVVGIFSFIIGRLQRDSDNWMVGGRSLPVYVVAGTQFATGMGGGVLVAHVGIGYTSGWSALTYDLIYAIGVVIFIILAKWLKEQNFTTMPEIIKKIYGDNKVMMSIVTLMSIIVPFGWLCTNLVAFGNMFSSITGLSFPLLVIVFAIISLIFVLPGGLTSVAWTDFIFGCMMVVMSVVSMIYALNMSGGWGHITQTVSHHMTNFPKGMSAVGSTTILFWILAILPGALTNQMSYQRIYAAKSVGVAKQGFIIAAIVGLLSGAWAAFMGIAIHSMNPHLKDSEMASGWFLTQIPTWFLALYSAFIIATIMSTVSSALQSVVVNITKDIYQSYINADVNDRKLLSLSRITTVIILILSVILALTYPKALGWLVATYAYSAVSLLVPIFAGFFLKNTQFLTCQGAIGSMVIGILSAAAAQIIGTHIPYVAYGLIGSFIGLFVVSFLTKSKSKSDTVARM
ncbi:sodium:solute symporter family protein [Scopulibacillus cellulosilyticus]|uniref:Sodium:solute symporter n=1 Tax=Scopulibacillus cellulosilyticus TaxID=2665665 RepID=A0ABW2Q183_9BACL